MRLARRFQSFRWINCYRPFDQVGTQIGLPNRSWLRETSTRQFKKIVSAHPNYWNDSVVRDFLFKDFSEVSFSGLSRTNAARSVSVAYSRAVRKRVTKILWQASLTLLFVGTPVYAITMGTLQHNKNLIVLKQKRERLNQFGVETHGKLIYAPESVQTSDYLTDEIRIFKFEFSDATGHPVNVEYREGPVPDLEAPSRFSFNVDKVAGRARSNGNKLNDILIRYLPEDPPFLDLPEYPPDRNDRRVKYSGFIYFQIVMVYLMGLLVAIPVAYLFAPLFIGEDLEEETTPQSKRPLTKPKEGTA
jgi:hypothetical protein